MINIIAEGNMTLIGITDISSGVTLRDIVGHILEGILPPPVIDTFVSDFANEWANFLLMDVDKTEWDVVAVHTEDCFNWIYDTLIELGLKDCERVSDLAEAIMDAAVDFMLPAMSEEWKKLVGV